MRIRTILAAAAAPAALAAVLLGTAGQASAAVTQGPAAAVLTANVQQTYTGKVSQTNVPDTTSVDTTVPGISTENNDSSLYGPIGPVSGARRHHPQHHRHPERAGPVDRHLRGERHLQRIR